MQDLIGNKNIVKYLSTCNKGSLSLINTSTQNSTHSFYNNLSNDFINNVAKAYEPELDDISRLIQFRNQNNMGIINILQIRLTM